MFTRRVQKILFQEKCKAMLKVERTKRLTPMDAKVRTLKRLTCLTPTRSSLVDLFQENPCSAQNLSRSFWISFFLSKT